MSTLQAMSVIALWDSGKLGTHEIAAVLSVSEAEVEKVIHLVREERRKRVG